MIYLVIEIKKQNILLYKIRADTAKLALLNYRNVEPYKDYTVSSMYGEGKIAIPYTTVNVLMTYIKILFAKKELSVLL